MKVGPPGLIASAWMFVRFIAERDFHDVSRREKSYEEILEERRNQIEELRQKIFEDPKDRESFEHLSELLTQRAKPEDADDEAAIEFEIIEPELASHNFDKPQGWTMPASDGSDGNEQVQCVLHEAQDPMCCPMTGERFKDPVIALDGYTYEREAMERWNAANPGSNLEYRENRLVKDLIEAYRLERREEFVEVNCPISHCPMKSPVVASDGYTYELNEIRKWVQKSGLYSPFTRKPLEESFIPNRILDALIRAARDRFAINSQQKPVSGLQRRSRDVFLSTLDTQRLYDELLRNHWGLLTEGHANALISAAERENAAKSCWCFWRNDDGTKTLARLVAPKVTNFRPKAKVIISQWLLEH